MCISSISGPFCGQEMTQHLPPESEGEGTFALNTDWAEWEENNEGGVGWGKEKDGKNGSVKGGMGEIREWEKDQKSRMREDTWEWERKLGKWGRKKAGGRKRMTEGLKIKNGKIRMGEWKLKKNQIGRLRVARKHLLVLIEEARDGAGKHLGGITNQRGGMKQNTSTQKSQDQQHNTSYMSTSKQHVNIQPMSWERHIWSRLKGYIM